ncbi:MAG: exo-alpha-sialidase [Chloroflexi bacterium]|nr:exo-alpha-sialidase [Chloroflexota bacterium]
MKNYNILLLLFLLSVGTGIGALSQKSAAQSLMNGQSAIPQWKQAELVAQDRSVNEPVAIADANGNVHLFWGRLMAHDEPGQIMHAMQDKTTGQWTEALDIFVAPRIINYANARVVLDPWGQFQLVWSSSGNSPEYWSWADSEKAHSAQAWQPPVAISHDAAFMATPALDEMGRLHVVYAITGPAMTTTTRGLYYLWRDPLTGAWSSPVLIATANEERGISDMRIALDARGCIHVVWSETLLTGYPPTGIYYANTCSGGQTWTSPLPLLGSDKGNPRIATVGEQEVHIIALGRNGYPGRFHTWSSDGGNTWSQPDIIAPKQNGLSGAGFAADSAGVLHWILIGGERAQFLWHTAWIEGRWTPLSPINDQAKLPTDRLYEEPSLTIVDGNRLLVAVKGATKDTIGVWFIEGVVDAPYVPYRMRPLGQAARNATPTKMTQTKTPVTSAPTFTPAPPFEPQTAPSVPMGRNPSWPLMVGALGAALVVCATVLFHLKGQGRHS